MSDVQVDLRGDCDGNRIVFDNDLWSTCACSLYLCSLLSWLFSLQWQCVPSRIPFVSRIMASAMGLNLRDIVDLVLTEAKLLSSTKRVIIVSITCWLLNRKKFTINE